MQTLSVIVNLRLGPKGWKTTSAVKVEDGSSNLTILLANSSILAKTANLTIGKRTTSMITTISARKRRPIVWFIIGHIFMTLLERITISRLSASEKDLEILFLRQQLAILQRRRNGPVRPSRIEIIRLFQPETVTKWHFCYLFGARHSPT